MTRQNTLFNSRSAGTGSGGYSAISDPEQPGQWHPPVFIRGNSGNKRGTAATRIGSLLGMDRPMGLGDAEYPPHWRSSLQTCQSTFTIRDPQACLEKFLLHCDASRRAGNMWRSPGRF